MNKADRFWFKFFLNFNSRFLAGSIFTWVGNRIGRLFNFLIDFYVNAVHIGVRLWGASHVVYLFIFHNCVENDESTINQ